MNNKKCKLVIKHNGEYYIPGKPKVHNKFELETFEIDYKDSFKNSNTEFRKKVADHIVKNTPFNNTLFKNNESHKAVSLYRKGRFFKSNFALFISNSMNENFKKIYLPYHSSIIPYSHTDSLDIIHRLRLIDNFPIIILYSLLCLLFICFSVLLVITNTMEDNPLNNISDVLEIAACIFTCINYLMLFTKRRIDFSKIAFRKTKFLDYISEIKIFLSFFYEIIVLACSILLAVVIERHFNFNLPINTNFFTGLSIAIILFDSIISKIKR